MALAGTAVADPCDAVVHASGHSLATGGLLDPVQAGACPLSTVRVHRNVTTGPVGAPVALREGVPTACPTTPGPDGLPPA